MNQEPLPEEIVVTLFTILIVALLVFLAWWALR